MIEIISAMIILIGIITWGIWERYGHTPIALFIPTQVLVAVGVLVTIVGLGLVIERPSTPNTSSRYLTIIMDVSPSMWSEESASTRYQRSQGQAIQAAQDFFEQCTHSSLTCQIQVIAYAGRAFELSSGITRLSDARDTISQVTPSLMRSDQVGYDGSNLGAAILLSESLSTLRGISPASTDTLVLTDGNNNVGIPLDQVATTLESPGEIRFIGKDGAVFQKDGSIVRDETGATVLLPHKKELYQPIIDRMDEIKDTRKDEVTNTSKTIVTIQEYAYLIVLIGAIVGVVHTKLSELRYYAPKKQGEKLTIYLIITLGLISILTSLSPWDKARETSQEGDTMVLEISEESSTKNKNELIEHLLTLQEQGSQSIKLLYRDDGGYLQTLFFGEVAQLSIPTLKSIIGISHPEIATKMAADPHRISKQIQPMFRGNLMLLLFGSLLLLVPISSLIRICRYDLRS